MREEIFVERNMSKYGIPEFAPDNAFDLVIETTHTSLEGVVKAIIEKVS
jgi:cytidylate kinase